MGTPLPLKDHEGTTGQTEPSLTPPAPTKTPKYIPFVGKDELPPYKVIQKAKKRGTPDRIEMGQARFIVRRGATDAKRYKLIAVFRTPSGIESRIWKTFKPNDRTRPQDNALLQELKRCRIPGAF